MPSGGKVRVQQRLGRKEPLCCGRRARAGQGATSRSLSSASPFSSHRENTSTALHHPSSTSGALSLRERPRMATVTTRSSSTSPTSPSRDDTSSRSPSWNSPTPSPSKQRRVAVVEIKTRKRSQTRSADANSPLPVTPSKGKENARPSRRAGQADEADFKDDLEGTASPTSASFDRTHSLPLFA